MISEDEFPGSVLDVDGKRRVICRAPEMRDNLFEVPNDSIVGSLHWGPSCIGNNTEVGYTQRCELHSWKLREV